jgi:hypothetical protein
MLIDSIYTLSSIVSGYPGYKIVVVQDPGQWFDYRRQEFSFTPGVGFITGRHLRKTINGNFYTTDSYKLLAYSFK